MSAFYRRDLPAILLAFVATWLLVDFYVSIPAVSAVAVALQSWGATLAAFAIILGLFNILRHDYIVAKSKKPGEWYLGVFGIVMLIATLLTGLVVSIRNPIYEWLWFYLSASIYAAALAIQGFYMVSASFRAFKAKSMETVMLLVPAAIVMIAYAPVITASFPQAVSLAGWVIDVPNTAAVRGITIGAGVGTIALGLRTILGKEKALALGGGEQ